MSSHVYGCLTVRSLRCTAKDSEDKLRTIHYPLVNLVGLRASEKDAKQVIATAKFAARHGKTVRYIEAIHLSRSLLWCLVHFSNTYSQQCKSFNTKYHRQLRFGPKTQHNNRLPKLKVFRYVRPSFAFRFVLTIYWLEF